MLNPNAAPSLLTGDELVQIVQETASASPKVIERAKQVMGTGEQDMSHKTSFKFHFGERPFLWALVFSFYLLVSQNANAADSLSTAQFTDLLSDKADLVRIQKGDRHYSIPRKFLLTALLPQSPPKTFFKFAFVFPERSSLTNDMAVCAKNMDDGRCRDIVVVATRDFEVPIEQFYQSHMEKLGSAPETINIHGLKKIVGTPLAKVMDTYIAEGTDSTPPVVIACSTSPGITRCNVETASKSGQRFVYTLQKVKLADWRAIDTAVHDLLESFTVRNP